jgi:endothelin-converting enzyme/putative endopeptidase
MDETRIESAGIAPVAPLLAAIDAARTPPDVQRALRQLHSLGVFAGFTASGAYAYRDPSRFVLNVAAGSFGVPHDAGGHDAYVKHVAAILAPGGEPSGDAAASAESVVALESRLAEGALDPAADPAQFDHPTTFAELVALTPSLDWPAYFDEAGLPRADVNVAEPQLLRQLDGALRETPVAVWRAYLRYELLDAAAPYLSRAFVGASPANGKPRARFCAESTEALLPDAVGRLFVERYFPPQDRARVASMVAALVAELKEDVSGVDWMEPDTRRRALEKLATYDAQVAAPPRWADYAPLAGRVRRDGFWESVGAARRFGVAADRRRVGRPTDRDVWALPASSSGAYIDAQLNQIVLPAGFLLAIGYRSDANDPELYGGLGAGIAHDVTHALDAGGADFDAQGRPARWWSDADRARFETRAACVAGEYAGFEVEPGLRLDGKRVLSEAIGDLGGVRIAYRALEKVTSHAKRDEAASEKGDATAQQRFFLAWARSRAEAIRPETERQLARTDPHAPGRFRVNGTLVNLPEFQQAFGCPAGSRMVRPPEAYCTVW